MKVSIVIPVYNKAAYIGDTIQSILNQNHREFELIIVDDGSTDGSQEIINSFHDERICFYQNEINLGTARIGNKLIDISSSEYILRMDADDIMLPERILSQIEYMEKNKDITVSSGSVQCFGSSNDIWSWNTSHDVLWSHSLFKSPIIQPAAILRKSHFEKFGFRYDNNAPNLGEDWLLWFQIAYKSKVGNIDKVLVKYRLEGQNITSGRGESYFEARNYLYSKIFSEIGLPADYLDIHILTKPEFSRELKKEDIKRFFEWMHFLVQFNLEKKVFNHELFLKEIKHRKNKLFYFILSNNRKLIRNYFYYNKGLSLSQSKYFLADKFKGNGKK